MIEYIQREEDGETVRCDSCGSEAPTGDFTSNDQFDGSNAHLLNSQGTLDGCSVCSGSGRVLDGEECQFCMGGTLLAGERVHISSVNCWCKPYQDDQCPDVWIHNELPSGRA